MEFFSFFFFWKIVDDGRNFFFLFLSRWGDNIGMERFGNIEAIDVMVLSFGIFRNCRVDDRFFFFSNFEIFLHWDGLFWCIPDSENALEILKYWVNLFFYEVLGWATMIYSEHIILLTSFYIFLQSLIDNAFFFKDQGF